MDLSRSYQFNLAQSLGQAPFSFPMNRKQDEIIFGARRAGVTCFYHFETRAEFKKARAGVKRLGQSLAQWLSWPFRWSADRDPIEGQRRFTFKDEEASTLKVRITQCDEFTRKCLERQVTLHGYENV